MKLRVLVENNTYIDRYYWGEPAFSCLLEDGDTRVLFDVGYSDALLRNAAAMGLDLGEVSIVAISHGHDDHTRGLAYLREVADLSRVTVTAHPDAFLRKTLDGKDIGAPFREAQLRRFTNLRLSRVPVQLTSNAVFLGEIPETFDFERRTPIGTIHPEREAERADLLLDDTAIACRCRDGLFLLTGCSHSGICNVAEHAKRVCGESRVCGILGGFHLFRVDERLRRTIDYFTENDIRILYPCHCVSFEAKAAIHAAIPIREVGVGLLLDL